MTQNTASFEFTEDPVPDAAIFVPSRHRANVLTGNVQSMLDTGLPVYVTVEPHDMDEYSDALPMDVNVVSIGEDDKGIGYARDQALQLAKEMELEWMIFVDDDVRVPSDRLYDLVWAADRWGLPGMGCAFRIYRHFLGMTPNTGPYLMRSGMGHGCYALNVEAAVELGGYDHSFTKEYEDLDLRLRMIAEGLPPWGLHSGVEGHLTLARGAPGGTSSVTEDGWPPTQMAQKHPEVCSVTRKGNLRTQWKKAFKRAGWTFPLEFNGLVSIESS